MKRLPIIGLLIACYLNAWGQDATCAQTLRLARATYEQGRLHEIEGQLKSCLESGFTKAEKQLKVEGYKILCLSYIYLEEPEKADQAMLNLKLTDPYYEPNPAVDPAEFVALFYTFRKDPIYRIGANIGVNASRANITEMVAAVELGPDSEVKPSYTIQFGLSGDLPMGQRLTIHADVLYVQHKFEIDEKVIVTEPGTGVTATNAFTGFENQTWLSLPISAEFTFLNPESKLNKKLHPYIAGGASVGYLLNAKLTGERTRENNSSIPESGIELEREKINVGVLAATGIKTKIASGLLVAEVRYVHGITNVSSEETAYANQKLLWDYGYADPMFKMSSLSVTFSYVQDIFKPKKLKRKQ